MEWYSWTSPLGSGLFILCLSAAFYIFASAIHTLTKAGKKAVKSKNQIVFKTGAVIHFHTRTE
jgi:hypothetical protein